MNKKSILLCSLFIFFGGALWAGFKSGAGDMTWTGGGDPLTTSPGQSEYSPKEQLLRPAMDFINNVLAFCSVGQGGSAPGITLNDLGTEVQSFIDNDKYCHDVGVGTSGTRPNLYAVSETRPTDGVFERTYQNGQSGTALNFKNLPCPQAGETPSMVDIALTASLLMHEAAHTIKGEDMFGPDGEANEDEARSHQVGFICCAMDYLDSLPSSPEVDAAKDQLCNRLNEIREVLCALGVPLITNCGCDTDIWGTALPWLLHGPPDQDPGIPRADLDKSNFEASGFGLSTGINRFSLIFAPAEAQLRIYRRTSSISEAWTYSVKDFIGSGFEPNRMFAATDNLILFLGRNTANGNGMVLSCRVGWNGTEPTMLFNTLLDSSEVGDLTDGASISKANDSVVLFDYTNARVVYMSLFDGSLTELIGYQSQPEVLDMQGVMAGYYKDPNTGEFIGIKILLQVSQKNVFGGPNPMILVTDLEADGVLDSVSILSFDT